MPSIDKACLSPISLIELYAPEPVNRSQQYPIYRSTKVSNRRSSRSLGDDSDRHHGENDSNLKIDSTTEFDVAKVQITPDTFLSMCPALLVQIEQGSCIERQYKSIPVENDPIFQSKNQTNETRNIGKLR